MHIPRIRILGAVGVLAATLVGLRAFAATWVPPSAVQPGGNVSPTLNSSAESQTKAGGLTVQGLVTLDTADKLVVGESPTNKGGICLPNPDNPGTFECKKGWSELTTNPDKLSLFPSEGDYGGYVTLKAPQDLDFGDGFNATVLVIAGQPTTTLPTYGLLGEASSEAGASYGIFAQADDPDYRALYATILPHGTSNGRMWAGYFSASMLVTDPKGGTCKLSGDPCADDGACTAPGDSCMPYPSIIVGGNGPTGSLDKDLGYICLNGDCRSQWPEVHGVGYWTGTSPVEPLAQYAGRSVAAGGAAASAGFTVKVSTDASLNPVKADVGVSGSAQFDSYVVGTPTNSTPVSMTCGDGICSGSENDTMSSPYYCPEDCDHTPPSPPDPFPLDLACPPSDADWCLPRGGGCETTCPRRSFYYLYFNWYNPPEADFVLTRVIVRTDRYPTSPVDTCTSAYCDTYDRPGYPDAFDVATSTLCDRTKNYFIGLFAKDAVGNFSSAGITQGYCTNRALMIYEV